MTIMSYKNFCILLMNIQSQLVSCKNFRYYLVDSIQFSLLNAVNKNVGLRTKRFVEKFQGNGVDEKFKNLTKFVTQNWSY